MTDEGTQSDRACAACGEPHGAGAKFCSECGAPVTGSSARGVRKTVTAVFADLVGSTPMQAAVDAETAHHVMERFYETMRDALEANGGRVSKFIGDAVVALFGYPVMGEDDALRAVRAAQAMRDALGPLNKGLEADWGVRIGMRVGVNTGEVVVSPGGLAVGDTLNVAARLEQNAPDGEVLIGEPTYRLVRHAVRCERMDPLTLKGKSEPVAAFRLVNVTPGAERRARIEAPLIGRDAELAQLTEAFDAAVESGACRLVTVIGSPGLGKTRLAGELAAAVSDRAFVVEGRCEPAGEGITWLPVAEVLRGAAGIGEADAPDVVHERLSALVPDDPDRELLVERAGGILGRGGVASAQETFWSVRRLLGGLARRRPLVVVLDDVHWGQPTFLDLIEHMAEWGREAPILLLALARPELRDMRPALARPGRLVHDVVELKPLAPAQSRELVSELLDRGEVPEALAGRVLATTEGNPLFLGETLRMLVDDGVLRREGDMWVAAGGADEVEVPPTISALLAARIERLDDDERSVVERAAVIGKQFYRGAVAELAPAHVAREIDGHLEALHRKEVIEPEGAVWIDEPVFRFHHVLIRDAAYRTLLKEARAELHERFADWLEAKAGELVGEHEEVIAFHLERAYEYRRELGPLDEQGRVLGRRAVARLHSAGGRALAREDLPAATNLLGRAARALPDDSLLAGDVLVDQLEALLSAGETAQVPAALEHLYAVAGADERLAAWGGLAAAQLTQLTDSARLHEALDVVSEAVDALTAQGDDLGVAKAHHVRAQGLALLGQVGEVEVALDQALAAARRAGDSRRVTAVLSGAPRAALWGPSPVMRASGRCLDVVRILRMTHGNRHVEAVALRCQAVLEAMRDRPDAAREILERCRMTLEELGLGMELLETELHAGIVELLAGDAVAAERHLVIARDGFIERGLDVGAASSSALLARALIEQGRDAEAETLTVFSEARGREDLKTTIAWCGARGLVLARRGEDADGEALARRAVDLAAGTDALVDHGDACMALAEVLRLAGREDDAIRQARRAQELYEAKGHEVGARRAAAFAHGDTARVAESELPAGVDGPVSRLIRRAAAAFNARDWGATRDCVTDDMITHDRRLVSTFGKSQGADPFLDRMRAYADLSDDMVIRHSQRIEAGHAGIAEIIFSGHQTESGSAFEVAMLVVISLYEGRWQQAQIFEADDLCGACEALLELQPDPALRPVWRCLLDYIRHIDDGDPQRALESFSPALVVVDRRRVSWGVMEGRDRMAELVRSLLAAVDGVSYSAAIIDTAQDAMLYRLRFEGRLLDGGGQFESESEYALQFRDGVAVRLDIGDDAEEMRACFEQLRDGGLDVPRAGPQAVSSVLERLRDERAAALDASLSTRPRVASSLMQRLVDAAVAHDWDGVRAGIASDFVAVDRRRISTWGTVDREGYLEVLQALIVSAGDARPEFEIVAEEDGVATVVVGWSGHLDTGGGRFELSYPAVIATNDDAFVRLELFDDDDTRGQAEAFERLRQRRTSAVARSERLARRLADAIDREEWALVSAMLAPDVRVVDHRRISPWGDEVRDRDAFIAFQQAMAASASGVRRRLEIEAATEGVIAGVLVTSGQLRDGGGPFEVALGALLEWQGDQLACAEFFDAEDTDAMLARFAAWNAARRPESQRSEQNATVELIAAMNARDWDGVARGLSPDLRVVNHRAVALFDELCGPDAYIAYLRSYVDVSSDAVVSIVQVGGDHRLAVWHAQVVGHYDDGGGEFILDFAAVIAADRQVHRIDYFDDDAASRRWYSELAQGPTMTLVKEVAEALAAHDWDRARVFFAPDFTTVDHRRVAVLGVEVPDADGFVERAKALLAVASDARPSIEPLSEADGVATAIIGSSGHMDEGGGRYELRWIGVIAARDGVLTRYEIFDEDDEDGARAASERLRRVDKRPEARRSERLAARLARAGDAEDWTVVTSMIQPDLTVVDHRLTSTWGDEVRDREGFVARERVLAESTHGLERRYDVVAAGESVIAGVLTFSGLLRDGGGPFELAFGSLMQWREDRLARGELFDLEDTEGMLARFAEWNAETQPEPRRAERLALRIGDAADRGDWETVSALLHPGVCVCDHRALSTYGDEVHDRDDALARHRFLNDSALTITRHYEATDATDDAVVGTLTISGTLRDGGGPFEMVLGVVLCSDGDRCTRMEFFDVDDEEAMLARFRELAGQLGSGAAEVLARRRPGVDLPREPLRAERWYMDGSAALDAAGRTGDWDAIRAVLTPDLTVVDHRRVATMGGVRDREDYLAREASGAEITHDFIRRYELLAATETLTAVQVTASGRIAEGDGPFEIALGVLCEWRDGIMVRLELFEAEDEEAMLARLHELASAPAGGTPDNLIARLHTRHCEAFNARDWPGVVSHIAEDFVVVDRRRVTPWPIIRGHAEFEAMWRNLLTMAPDLQVFFEFVEGDDETAIVLYGGRGHAADGGGEMEILTASLFVTRGGLGCYVEAVEADEVDTLRARREELRPLAHRRPAVELPLEPLPVERLTMRLGAALDQQDWETAGALLAPDVRVSDRRAISTLGDTDRAGFLDLERALAESSQGATRGYEVVAARGSAISIAVTLTATMRDGGGDSEIALGAAMEWRDGICVRLALFDAGDDEVLRCCAEWAGSEGDAAGA